MTAPQPVRWTLADLTADVATAMEDFRKERLAEPLALWKETFREHAVLFRKLFDEFGLKDPSQLSAAHIVDLYEKKLGHAFRYLAAPPISDDDLKVLAESTLSQKSLKTNPDQAERVLKTVLQALDPMRFPWVKDSRTPTTVEWESAILASAALMTAQRVATTRRNTGKDTQEKAVKDYLRTALNLTEVPPHNINTLMDAPAPGSFSGEANVVGRKADIVVVLYDKRLLLIECKVSNSALNSVKRVNNDAGAKASAWVQSLGDAQVVPAAMLSGVFKAHNLEQAQARKLSLFWAHRLTDLEKFILSTRPKGKSARR